MKLVFATIGGMIFLALYLAPSALAQMIKRADKGAVHVVLFDPPEPGEMQAFERDDTVWSEPFEPAHFARLKTDVPYRIRPNTPAVPAGTLLFGIDIQSGRVFCPVIPYEAPVSRVQCFQDLNDDRIFDAGYHTDQRGFDSQFLSAWVRGLQGFASGGPAYEFESTPEDRPQGTARFVFKGFRDDYPSFDVYFEDERLDERIACEPLSETRCTVFGYPLTFERIDRRSINIQLEGTSRLRMFSVQSQ